MAARLRNGWRRHLAGLLLALLAGAPAAAAATLTVTLSDTNFADLGNGDVSSASGSFDYDPSSGAVLRSSVSLSYPALHLTTILDDLADSKVVAAGSGALIELASPLQCPQPFECSEAAIVIGTATPPVAPGTYPLACCGVAAGNDTVVVDLSTYEGGISSGSLQVGPSGGPAGQLYVVSPFLLGAPNLADIDLASLIPTIGSWSAVGANGLAADNTSAAIALWQTTTPADVTFTANNGATLLAYANDFLTTPPAAGAASLTVPAADMIDIGGTYYAAALVETPAAGVPFVFSAPITVTAATAGSPQATAALALAAPPVILVHGLWGDANSLEDLQNYLTGTAPWSAHPELVQPIAYRNYVAFDAPEPASVLNNQILTELGTLDDEHIVGGRVDVVAHSMGGLVARHFTALTDAYIGLRDREQGKFREIVTLDTPEAGSALAQYLLDHRRGHVQSFAPPLAQAVWLIMCNPPSETVEKCFDQGGMRLGPPGRVEHGAVASLVPGSRNLERAPSPEIPGAIWRAVTAIVPQTKSTFQESALELELQQIIAATWPDPNTPPPTIADILGDERQDDAIVPLASQMGGMPSGSSDFATFSKMAHSPAPLPEILDLVLSNSNVTQSAAVDLLAGCWLSTGGASSCTANAAATAATGAVQAPPFAIDRLHPVRRLTIARPREVRLATPFDLGIGVAAPGLLRLVLRQRDELGHQAKPQVLTLARGTGGAAYVTVTPLLFGRVTFTLDALFRDGGLASSATTVPVRLPSAPPTLFLGDANARRIRIGLLPDLNVYELRPQARYPGTPRNIDLDGRAVRYRVLPGPGAASVELTSAPDDPSMIRLVGRSPGTATVEARLGTAVDYLQVIVVPE